MDNIKRNNDFFRRASMGFFTIKYSLYFTEAQDLEKDGFRLTEIKGNNTSPRYKKKLYIVSWGNPYFNNIPKSIQKYLNGNAKFPKNDVQNFAQSLFVTAAKFNKSF